jgi:hypothetical protein
VADDLWPGVLRGRDGKRKEMKQERGQRRRRKG